MKSLIIVEGNISAGKSTLTKHLASSLNCRVFLEPTETNPFLADFYKDPAKYALRMQLFLLKRRFRTYLEAIRHMAETGEGAVLDRSIFSDWVFAEKNRVDGNIGKEGFEYYSVLRNQLLQGLPCPLVTVYLDVTAKECHRRIHGLRQRESEVDGGGIPLEYLEGLENCYEDLLQEMEERGSRVLKFDWGEFGSAEEVAKDIKEAFEEESAKKQQQKKLQEWEKLIHQADFVKDRMEVKGCDFVPDWDDDHYLDEDLAESNEIEMKSVRAPSPGSPVGKMIK